MIHPFIIIQEHFLIVKVKNKIKVLNVVFFWVLYVSKWCFLGRPCVVVNKGIWLFTERDGRMKGRERLRHFLSVRLWNWWEEQIRTPHWVCYPGFVWKEVVIMPWLNLWILLFLRPEHFCLCFPLYFLFYLCPLWPPPPSHIVGFLFLWLTE